MKPDKTDVKQPRIKAPVAQHYGKDSSTATKIKSAIPKQKILIYLYSANKN